MRSIGLASIRAIRVLKSWALQSARRSVAHGDSQWSQRRVSGFSGHSRQETIPKFCDEPMTELNQVRQPQQPDYGPRIRVIATRAALGSLCSPPT